MIIRFLQILAMGMILIGATAFAQPRDVPNSREQVMLSYSPLVKQVSPAVVNIYTKRLVTKRISPFGGDPFFEQFFGRGFGGGLNRQQIESSLGTGVIVDAQGVLITNAHVIKGAQEIVAVLADGREFDNSYSRGNPIEFPLGMGRVIPGWDEGIQLLKVGDKARLVIPSE